MSKSKEERKIKGNIYRITERNEKGQKTRETVEKREGIWGKTTLSTKKYSN